MRSLRVHHHSFAGYCQLKLHLQQQRNKRRLLVVCIRCLLQLLRRRAGGLGSCPQLLDRQPLQLCLQLRAPRRLPRLQLQQQRNKRGLLIVRVRCLLQLLCRRAGGLGSCPQLLDRQPRPRCLQLRAPRRLPRLQL
jgi:hypothetical protein